MDILHQETFESIENIEFDAQMSVSAGLNSLVRNIREDPRFIILRNTVDSGYILNRMEYLAEQPIDMEYQNHNDIAFTSYLLALKDQGNPEEIIGGNIVRRVPNLWYAAKIAHSMLDFVKIVED